MLKLDAFAAISGIKISRIFRGVFPGPLGFARPSWLPPPKKTFGPATVLISYMILIKISFWYESFRNEFLPVVAPDRNVCSGMISSSALNKYHVKDVHGRAHCRAELGTWIGLADQLNHTFVPLNFYRTFTPE